MRKQTNEECESKLSIVVRLVQEGKTYICISNIINDQTRNIHIVLHMNTLSAGMQLFSRMKESVRPENIIVFNSSKESAGECCYARTIGDVFKLLRNNKDIKVIVCCAHEKRIKNSIPDLLEHANDSNCFSASNRKFIIHVDEAHKYIIENKSQIRLFNSSTVVEKIIGYSATPNGIWSNSKSDTLFHKILIFDVEAELAIIRSTEYFGVCRCDFHISEVEITVDEVMKQSNINAVIPQLISQQSDMDSQAPHYFYGENYYFDLGNEILLLSYVKYILPKLSITDNTFSYNFVPAYSRKATHYYIGYLIFEFYPNANVIVMNGNGMEFFKYVNGHKIRLSTSKQLLQLSKLYNRDEYNKLLEPSYMIQQMIQQYANCPTFITGFHCVGMSVTLINETLGNFDNVIMDHHHYKNDVLYQLCRFVFNYMKWSTEGKSKIKITKVYSLTKHVVDICLEYEESVERMSNDFAGKICTIREINGLEPEQPTEREVKKAALASLKLKNGDKNIWKKYKVYDGNDAEEWEKVSQFYREFMNKELGARSKPKLVDGLYWHCSTTGHVLKQSVNTVSKLKNQSWWSTFQLKEGCLKYARLFVGYENLEDPSEYTIYLKYVELEDNEESKKYLEKYCKKKSCEEEHENDGNQSDCSNIISYDE